MRIKILEVESPDITFSGSAGIGIGKCSRENLKSGMMCDLELDVEDLLEVGKNVILSEDKHLYIENNNGFNYLNAIVEMIDEDGEVCLRLADDCIIIAYQANNDILVGNLLLLTLPKGSLKLTLIGQPK